ncbi:MAG TPA: hypothetical protein VFB08_02765 [Burkholderiales bacterium]|nr:hypothetical protein [Burkholderiales bacterium]
MSSAVESHVFARIAEAAVQREPFAHCVIDGIFPREFYESIVDEWPTEEAWLPLGESGRVGKGTYASRMVVLMNDAGYARLDEERRRFWVGEVGGWLLGTGLRRLLLEKFADDLATAGFGAPLERTAGDALLVSDRTRYKIGPHTDAQHRVVSLLFYLPEDAAFRRFGTSFYVPRTASFRCRGGPHHPFALFERVKTVEFVPNRLVIFPKTDRCFHGVEDVDLPGIERRLLIYNVRRTS